MAFRGISPPRTLPQELRRPLLELSEYLQRERHEPPAQEPLPAAQAPPLAKGAGGNVTYRTITDSGTIATLPAAPAHTVLILRALYAPTFKASGGNLRLVADWTPRSENETLEVVSDGSGWWEVSRSSAGAPTFVPAALWGAVPDTGSDISAAVQAAVDGAPDGATLFFAAGTYVIGAEISVARSNLTIWLDPGASFEGVSANTVGAVINLQGTITATTALLAADVGVGGQEGVTLYSTAAFSAGDWVFIEDLFPPADPGAIHRELNRIRSIDSPTTLTLYYPTVDAYTTALSGKLVLVEPVENVRVTGGGRVTNTGLTSSVGGHGIRVEAGVGCRVDGVEATDCRNTGVALRYSLGLRVTDCFIHDAPIFNGSNGYGITTTGTVGTIIANNTVFRCRHLIDVSFFSRMTAVSGNVMHAGGYTTLQIHPNVTGTTIFGNTIDGTRGYSQPDPATEMSDGGFLGVSAPAVVVREFVIDTLIASNTIVNAALSGVHFLEEGCSGLRIINNTIRNCNYRDDVASAGIACATNLASECPGLVIDGNHIQDCGRSGITIGFSRAIVRGNTIVGTGGTSPTGILLTTKGSLAAEDVLIEGNVITGGSYGVFLGGNNLGGTGSVVGAIVRGNTIDGAALSGIFQELTSSVNVVDATIEENAVRDCNTANNNDHGGIVAVERNTQGTAGHRVFIRRNRVLGPVRYGIICGLDDSVVEGNTVLDVSGAVGMGIWVRAIVLGSFVRRLRVLGNHIAGCTTSGIRIGSPSGAGTIVGAFVRDNHCRGNGHGIEEQDLATGTLFLNNVCLDSTAGTSYGLYLRGDGALARGNVCSDTGGATQDFGIYVETTASGARLVDNLTEGNGTAGIRNTGTSTQYLQDELMMMGF